MKAHICKALLLIGVIFCSPDLTWADQAEDRCVRGGPEPLFSGQSPDVKGHEFTRTSSHEADESVLFASGDRLVIRNWGCEYFVNTFRFESKSIEGHKSSPPYWHKVAAHALRTLAASEPDIVFDLKLAARTLEIKVSNSIELKLDDPYPVEGDGTDFLQSHVAVKASGKTDKGVGFVVVELSKGPL